MLCTVSDTKSWGQPACHGEQKKWRNEDASVRINVMYSISVNVHMYVMFNMKLCYASIIIGYSLYIGEKHSEGKDVGEIWAAVNKSINSILWTSVASNRCPPEWGQSRSHYMARRGPCRTYSRDASRRPKPKYVHSQYMRVVFDAIYNHVMYVLAMTYKRMSHF
jgi:hypothetical protein